MISITTLIAGLGAMSLLAASIDAARRCSLQAIARSRQPASASPALSVVETHDRRTQQLPFVGKDRRQVNVESATLVDIKDWKRQGGDRR